MIKEYLGFIYPEVDLHYTSEINLDSVYFYLLFLRHNLVLVIQSCLTLHDTMDCSLAGSSVHGILQARIVEWIAISFSRGSRLRDQTWVSHIRGIFFTIWATREKEKTLVEKTLESPLDSKEIKRVNPKGNQPWIFIGRTDAKAPILWPLDAKSNSLEKTLMLGKIEGKKIRGAAEDEMAGWHHWVNGHKFEQALGDGEGQGSPVCCSPWGHKELAMTCQQQ